jgi:hypothetical protein
MSQQEMVPPIARFESAAWIGARLHRPAFDGWIGIPEYPGYRAGALVAKLSHLPAVAAHHLYFDVLLLDAGGRTEDAHGGICVCLALDTPLEDRSRFVRVVAELLRHAADDSRRFHALARPLAVLREQGIARGPLLAAAQLLDNAASERAVARSLVDMLVLSLGEDEAQAVLDDVIERLTRNRLIDDELGAIHAGDLQAQTAFLVHTLGKHRARRHLRAATLFDLLPSAEMLGL